MIKIESKNKNYTGVTANIHFEKGIAVVEDLSNDLKLWFKGLGCKIEEEKKTKVKSEKGE